MTGPTQRPWPHYFSTYCIHERHDNCRLACKMCNAPCRCSCHSDRVAGQVAVPERDALIELLRAHLPKDRYDDGGHIVGTYCTGCDWEGDYFADGEAGPFDDHLADAVLASGWLPALAEEWGVEFEGEFFPLDPDVPNARSAAERGVVEAVACGADPEATFVAVRRLTPWTRALPGE